MKRTLILALVAILSLSGFAQTKKEAIDDSKKPEVQQMVVIQTNGVCGMCKDRIMENVPFFKGISDCSYDMATSKVTVKYDPKKTTPDAIRQGISKIGYDADAVKADAAVRAKLPACCRADKKDASQGSSSHCGQH
ncbi:MAG: heavy-metal-associated domain-containing protein [Bacteroidales bacterium]|jgi:copper chaperone CopZ|nr:heavy-metal-associated domain-containing protein [Bacteroidales bacterium]